jgi:hypothetical protein
MLLVLKNKYTILINKYNLFPIKSGFIIILIFYNSTYAELRIAVNCRERIVQELVILQFEFVL